MTQTICPQIFKLMIINPFGKVSPCCYDWEDKLTIGDVHDETLYDIWNGKKLNHLQRQFCEKGKNWNSLCQICHAAEYCDIDNVDDYKENILEKIKRD